MPDKYSEFQKVVRVFESCKTSEQINVAHKYFMLFLIKYHILGKWEEDMFYTEVKKFLKKVQKRMDWFYNKI